MSSVCPISKKDTWRTNAASPKNGKKPGAISDLVVIGGYVDGKRRRTQKTEKKVANEDTKSKKKSRENKEQGGKRREKSKRQIKKRTQTSLTLTVRL